MSRCSHIHLLGGRRRKRGRLVSSTSLQMIYSSILRCAVRRLTNRVEEVLWQYCLPTALNTIAVVGAHGTDTYVHMVSILSKPDETCRRLGRRPPSLAPTYAASATRCTQYTASPRRHTVHIPYVSTFESCIPGSMHRPARRRYGSLPSVESASQVFPRVHGG